MIRVIGFALFFIAVGILIMMCLPSNGWGIAVMLGCLLIGYNLFCCNKDC